MICKVASNFERENECLPCLQRLWSFKSNFFFNGQLWPLLKWAAFLGASEAVAKLACVQNEQDLTSR